MGVHKAFFVWQLCFFVAAFVAGNRAALSEPRRNSMPVTSKKQIDLIGNGTYQGPAHKCKPMAFAHQFPCHTGDIQPENNPSISQFAMQDAVGLHRIYVREAFTKVDSVNILQIKLAIGVQ
jgi:hypothetical protein